MKKFEGVLKRVRALEEKNGIRYSKPDGKLYKTLKVLYVLVFSYTMVINTLFLLGMWLNVDAGIAKLSDVFNYLLSVLICSVLIIAGLVFSNLRFYLTAGLMSTLPSVFLMPVYAVLLREDFGGILGLKYSFYYKHGIPLALMILFMVWITVIAKRAEIKTDRMYKKVTENLFGMYTVAEGDAENLSEEQWAEFLEKYNPDDYQRHSVISAKEEITEEADTDNEG